MDNEEIKELFAEAIEEGEFDEVIDAIDENRDDFAAYDDFWSDVEKLLENQELEDCIDFLGTVCSVPHSGAKEALVKIAKALDIPSAIEDDEDLKEELFLAIQMYVKNYYIDTDCCTKPAKENISKVAKMLAVSFEAFGYGVCENGLLIVIRSFNNDVNEGLYTSWYSDEVEYDPEEFGYYDGIENEDIFDKFYLDNPIKDLIK